MSSYKVYCWINKVNGKRYVGMTCQTMNKRAGSHMHGYLENATVLCIIDTVTTDVDEIKETIHKGTHLMKKTSVGIHGQKFDIVSFQHNTQINQLRHDGRFSTCYGHAIENALTFHCPQEYVCVIDDFLGQLLSV